MQDLFSPLRRSYQSEPVSWSGFATLFILLVMYVLGMETVFEGLGRLLSKVGITCSRGSYLEGGIVYVVQMCVVWVLILWMGKRSWKEIGFCNGKGQSWISLILWSIGAVMS